MAGDPLPTRVGRWLRLGPMYLAIRYGDRAARRFVPTRHLDGELAPGVSLIIPDRGTPDLLGPTLASATVALARIGEPVQLVVVVNGGDRADYAALIAAHPQTQWQFHPQALGFNGAIEAGLRDVRHHWTYLLNSDMRLAPDAIAALLPYRDASVFSLTSQIFFADPQRRREETGWSDFHVHGARPVMFERNPEASPFARGCLYGGGGSALFQTALLRRYVRESRGFSPFYFEDTDWGVRAWEDDRECVFVPASHAVHEHRGTVRRFYDPAEVERVFDRNALLFELRHRFTELDGKRAVIHLSAQPPETQRELCTIANAWQVAQRRRHATTVRREGLDLASCTQRWYAPAVLRGARPKLLIVSPFAVFPPAHGGARRIAELTQRLAARFELILLGDERSAHSLASEAGFAAFRSVHLVQGRSDRADEAPQSLHARLHSHANAALRAELRRLQRVHRPDAVQIEFMEAALLAEERIGARPFVLDLHDVYLDGGDSDAEQRQALHAFDRLLVCSTEDAAWLDPLRATLVPNAAQDRMDAYRPSSDTPELLFMGPFRYAPNLDGLRAFLSEVWPALRARHPALTLTVLAGDGAAAHLRREPALAPAGVTVIDRFVDPTDHLVRAALTLNPQREIRGSALKVAESLLAGRVCVSTEAGARGYGADAGPGLVRVADVAAMGDAIGALLRDRTRRHGIEAAAVDVRRRLGWTHSVDALCAVYRELGLKNDVAESGHG